ncbi:MAG: hypothetical protein B193_1416 [Solidesulfovibrio magneticus str. Maddingley MBC34]|uniref:Uncharacterized protein n=1 Tax=Solidesulfovibrio magneticus str. Maddingley MBC34 TaxID=1206767 RepID=K6GFM0_9BACT|nr:MAG: hypothetical protein B193_1416 [Solidesulfovibrio magneticus str. Maddingley MBC34]
MLSEFKRTLCLLSAVAFIALSIASGCVRRTTLPSDVSSVTVYQKDRAMIVHRGDEGDRLYYRDDNGKIYYVDQSGRPVVVERNVRVERGTAGMYYIMDEDNVTYYTNEYGRLYYRDASGRDVFIEEAGAGKVIDPLPLLSGGIYPRVEQVRSLGYCNSEWRSCNARCYDPSGLGNRRSCLESCDYQREQCLKPY